MESKKVLALELVRKVSLLKAIAISVYKKASTSCMRQRATKRILCSVEVSLYFFGPISGGTCGPPEWIGAATGLLEQL